MSVTGQVEEGARRHYGMLELVQTAIGSLILLVMTIGYNALKDSIVTQQSQALDIAGIHGEMKATNRLVDQNQQRTDTQVAALAAVTSALVKMDTKQLEDEAKIEELRKTRPLR